jgi:uncharacterized phiE125 gp8 family phage protein
MLTLIGAPNEPILTLAEVKLALRIDTDAEDSYLQSLILVAQQYLDGRDGILGRCLRQQTWQLDLPNFPAAVDVSSLALSSYRTLAPRPLRLPLPPTIAVNSINYYDQNETLTLWAATEYRVIAGGYNGALIVPRPGKNYPNVIASDSYPDAIQIEFEAGYQDLNSPTVEAIPEPIRQAAILLIGDYYENRVNTVLGVVPAELPTAVSALIAPYRILPFA